jgi:hypothetical protein
MSTADKGKFGDRLQSHHLWCGACDGCKYRGRTVWRYSVISLDFQKLTAVNGESEMPPGY